MSSTEPEGRSRDELLAQIYRRGAAYRNRRRAAWAGLVVVLVAAAGLTVPVLARSDAGQRVAAGGGATTVTADATALAAAPSESAPADTTIPETTVPATTATTSGGGPATTTSSTPVCRNSTDPACGPFFWDPPPAPNQPLTFTVSVSPANPAVGEEVTFSFVKDDPDASVEYVCGQTSYGTDEFIDHIPCPGQGCMDARYGPWTPPAPEHGHREFTSTYTYTQPGTYTASFSTRSGDLFGCNPYTSDAALEVTVVVSP